MTVKAWLTINSPSVFCRITKWISVFPYVFASVSFRCPVSWVICMHLILCWLSALFHFHFYRFGIFLFSIQIITSCFKPWADLSSFSSSSQVTRLDTPETNLTGSLPCIFLESWCVQGQSGINFPLHKGFNLFSCPLPLWIDIYAARTEKRVPSLPDLPRKKMKSYFLTAPVWEF